MNHILVILSREQDGRDATPSVGIIDSQSVKTTENGDPRGYDAGKKIKGRNRYIAMRNQSIKFTGIRNGYKILTLCIFTIFPLWAYAQSTTPAQEVLEFYQKYMITCDHMFSNDGTKKERDGLFCNMDIGKYITKKLHKKIISAYESGTYSDLTGDRDYFTHTQDFDARWASFMSVTEIKADRNNSVIRLFMNFPKGAGEPLAVCVRLHRESSVWKIYQVDPSLYTDLPDCKDK